MKKILIIAWFVVSLPCSILTAGLCAQSASDELADEEAADSEMQGSVSGIIVSVNPALGMLVLRQDEGGADLYTIFTAKDTSFEGQIGSLKDISSGDRVSVDYFIYNDKMIADSISLDERVEKTEGSPAQLKVLESPNPGS
jgi:hypothetical protein